MYVHSYTNDVAVPSSQRGTAIRYEGRSLEELESIKILWSLGIRFSKSKGRARRESPVPYLLRNEAVPPNLKFVVLTKHAQPGNKAWGRISYLVRFRGYQLLDERS